MVLQEILISGFPSSSIMEAQCPSLVPTILPSASKAAMITSGYIHETTGLGSWDVYCISIVKTKLGETRTF